MSDVIELDIASTGKSEKFKQLSLHDALTLLGEEKQRRKRQLKENMAEAGVSGIDALGFFQAFDATSPTIYAPRPPDGGWQGEEPLSLMSYGATDEGKIAIIRFAYAAANPGVEGSLALSQVECVQLIEKLFAPFGINFVVPKEEPAGKPAEDKPPENPDPNRGQAYGK